MSPTALAGLDLDWVTPGLAVGGAFPTSAIPTLAAGGVGAVIDLRSEAKDDAAGLARAGIALLHLPTQDHCALSQRDMDAGVAFALPRLGDGGVLVHCREGIGRSVTLCLCILTATGMTPLQAMRTIKAARVWASPSPPQFDAFATWLGRRGIEAPPFQALAAIAYSHLG
ncbi:dual specificity protein phosphatase family protein [Caulobacter sp. S45]|uniref:protein-tyrosine phosphatase family protein n=1 Tax=Caulobacter sp. S45 TaxID=1641861 RepID=UPI00157753D2|nr:dual specificity protein phosphatase family protein [Caulobacter sp. S45]